MDPKQSHADVVVIQGARIVDVGDKCILNSYPDAEAIDLCGRTLLPAFIDAHNHLSFACFIPLWVNICGLTSKDAIQEAVEKHVRDHPGRDWVVGFPWRDAYCGGIELTRKELDGFGLDRPVLIMHETWHKFVASSQALKLAGITASTPDPNSGKIIRDSDGEPTGVLLESAGAPLLQLALETSRRRFADLIEARAKELLALGVTAIHDPGVTPAAEAAYRLLHEEGRLPVSVLMMPHGDSLLDNRIENRLNSPITGAGDERLRVGPIKLFGDGGVPGTVAFSGKIKGRMYADGMPRDDFRDELIKAIGRGFQVCIHSLGNVTADAVLESFGTAIEQSPEGRNILPRVDHVFLLSQAQITRLASMGGCAAVQPCFLNRAERLKRMAFEGYQWFAFKDLVKRGVVVAGSSDDPNGIMDGRDPLKCCVMGATMSDDAGNVIFPDQTMPFEQWLWIYTEGSAIAGGQENERGMLRKGRVADMVIPEGELDPKNPPFVAETWVRGERIYVNTEVRRVEIGDDSANQHGADSVNSSDKAPKKKGPSTTAQNVAFVRALESQKPEGERIYYDQYAIKFLSPEYLKFLEISIQSPEKAVFPGVQNSLVARARFIDDLIEKLIKEGLMQLVILGAGYDSRAYRIEGLKKIRIFEVDHPVTQNVKLTKIKEALGSHPEYVTYVPADLETEDFGQRLMEHGYERLKKTLFIMEGLLYYLPSHTVERILSFIAKNSSMGSAIVFDYIPESSVGGINARCGTLCTACDQEALKKAREDLKQQGEPYKFGIKEEMIEQFLVEREFCQIHNVTSEDYKEAYFHGVNKDRSVCNLLSFAYAVVK